MCIGSVSNDHIHLLTYIGFVAKVKWVYEWNYSAEIRNCIGQKNFYRNKNLTNENKFL